MKTLDWLQKWDIECVLRLFRTNAYQQLLPLSRWVSKSGDGWLYAIVGISSLLILGIEHLYFWALLLAFAIERPLYYILKNTLRRNRPFRVIDIPQQMEPSDAFSFPSGHTSSAFVFAWITVSFIPMLLVPLILWATIVGFSRVVLGVHFPTDILIGVLMGTGIAKMSLNLLGL